MNLLWSNQRGPVPGDEDSVRSTVTVVEDDVPAEMVHAPEYNETVTDPDTGGGLTSRQVSSFVIPSSQSVPDVQASAQDEHNAIVNRQVSSSGDAAAKEATGAWGHGTFKVVQGIEPTLVDGHEMGSDYFRTHERPDSASGSYLTPARVADSEAEQAAQAMSTRGARHAVQDSMYSAYYNGFQGGN